MKTKHTEYHITGPLTAGGRVLEVVEEGACAACLRSILPGEFVTRKYSRAHGVQVPLCRTCNPFRFVAYWDEYYHEASETPMQYTRGRKPTNAARG